MLIHPFSFEETLRHQGRSCPADPAVVTDRERARLERALLDWLETGGFPEAQGLDGLDPASRYQLLRDYVDVAMLRDVVEPHNVRNVASLRTSRGRLDMTVRFAGAVYLFEFKVVEQAGSGSALAQLKVRGYAEKHRRPGRAIHLIGIEFSSKARNVVAFDVERD